MAAPRFCGYPLVTKDYVLAVLSAVPANAVQLNISFCSLLWCVQFSL
jgi:hypothetical protein